LVNGQYNGLFGNELATHLTSLVELCTAVYLASDPLLITKNRHTQFSIWRKNLPYNSLYRHIPSVSPEELALKAQSAKHYPASIPESRLSAILTMYD